MTTLGALAVGLLVLALFVGAGIAVLAWVQHRSRAGRPQPLTVADLVRMREAAAEPPRADAAAESDPASAVSDPSGAAPTGAAPGSGPTGSTAASPSDRRTSDGAPPDPALAATESAAASSRALPFPAPVAGAADPATPAERSGAPVGPVSGGATAQVPSAAQAPPAVGSGADAPWTRAARMSESPVPWTEQTPAAGAVRRTDAGDVGGDRPPVGRPGAGRVGPSRPDARRRDRDRPGGSHVADDSPTSPVPEPRPAAVPPPPRVPFGTEQYRSAAAPQAASVRQTDPDRTVDVPPSRAAAPPTSPPPTSPPPTSQPPTSPPPTAQPPTSPPPTSQPPTAQPPTAPSPRSGGPQVPREPVARPAWVAAPSRQATVPLPPRAAGPPAPRAVPQSFRTPSAPQAPPAGPSKPSTTVAVPAPTQTADAVTEARPSAWAPRPAPSSNASAAPPARREDPEPATLDTGARQAGPAQRPADTAAEQAAADLAVLRTFGGTGRPHAAPEETALRFAGRPAAGGAPSGVAQTVAFRVTHRDGRGVGSASITLLDDHGREIASTVADADGRGALTAQHSGGYVLVTAAEGYQPGATAIVDPDGPVDVRVRLTRSASIAGTVCGEDGPLVGARVALVQDGEVVDASASAVDGVYRFTDLAAGEYGLSVSAPECEPAAVVVRLAEEVDMRRDIDLGPAGRPADEAAEGDVPIGRP